MFYTMQYDIKQKLRIQMWGFPGGAVVKNLPANAGHTGQSPGLGRSHVPRSNQAHEPQPLSLRVWSLCSATGEAATVRGLCTAMKSGPRLPQLEKALTQKRRPNTVKKKKKRIQMYYYYGGKKEIQLISNVIFRERVPEIFIEFS